MRNSDGKPQNLNGNNNQLIKVSEKRTVPKFVTEEEDNLLDLLRIHDLGEMVESFKMLHDFALYHSDVDFYEREKQALFELKFLWGRLEEINNAR